MKTTDIKTNGSSCYSDSAIDNQSAESSDKLQNVAHSLEPRILIVEDSLDNQILIKALLSKKSKHIDLASNGLVGVNLAMCNSYDLILMDIEMPEMNGFEALDFLRTKGYMGKIVALTAHAMKGDREHCLQKGFDDYLCKPLNVSDLFECVNRHWT